MFFQVLPKADRPLLLRGLLPVLFALAMGILVGAVERGDRLAMPLGMVGVVFVLLQVLSPLHQAIGANLASRTARIRGEEWRSRLAGAFQDFFRFEFRARQTVGPGAAAYR